MPSSAPHPQGLSDTPLTTRAERMMHLALQAANKARGRTRPNPMVGCVIARGERVIAVGYHARAGGPHAEVVALKKAGAKAKGADVYVTLEPCNHHGRTGPCTEALISAGVRRVFVGVRDPNPIVDGRGLRRLRQAGIEVSVGTLADDCDLLNEAFTLFVRHKRPLIAVKIAQSIDGAVATASGESKWITGAAARKMGHHLRNWYDAIIVGVGTVLADNPQLTCRVRGGRDPIRVILDTHARTPPDAAIIAQSADKVSTAPTWIMVGEGADAERVARLRATAAEVFVCPLRGARIDVQHVLKCLGEREVLSALVEGGPTLIGGFFDAHAVERLYAFIAPRVIGGMHAKHAVGGDGISVLNESVRLVHAKMSPIGDDWLIEGRVQFGGSDL